LLVTEAGRGTIVFMKSKSHAHHPGLSFGITSIVSCLVTHKLMFAYIKAQGYGGGEGKTVGFWMVRAVHFWFNACVDQYRCVLYMCVAFVEKAKLA
jgi:hypothetical protein